MTSFAATLHTDNESTKTASSYGDVGDGVTNDWHTRVKMADGAAVTIGAKADAAVTNPASSGSAIALLKGLLTVITTLDSNLARAEDAAHTTGDKGILVSVLTLQEGEEKIVARRLAEILTKAAG